MKKIITFAMVLLTVAMSAQVKQQNTMKKEAKKQLGNFLKGLGGKNEGE